MEKEILIALKAALLAGREILEVYASQVAVELKEDRSPLTEADKRAHRVIVETLTPLQIPILSEEGKYIPYAERSNWELFWLVDPLDGTKEFIKRNGEFTVNIALIQKGEPIAGIVYTPVTGTLYFSLPAKGAFRISNITEYADDLNSYLDLAQPLPCEQTSSYTIVASRSHMSPETEAFVNNLKLTHGSIQTISKGSSLKLCLVAEGSAHVYPRFAPTMEWDTGAGHALLNAVGKKMVNPVTGQTLEYNKEDLLNPWFIAG